MSASLAKCLPTLAIIVVADQVVDTEAVRSGYSLVERDPSVGAVEAIMRTYEIGRSARKGFQRQRALQVGQDHVGDHVFADVWADVARQCVVRRRPNWIAREAASQAFAQRQGRRASCSGFCTTCGQSAPDDPCQILDCDVAFIAVEMAHDIGVAGLGRSERAEDKCSDCATGRPARIRKPDGWPATTIEKLTHQSSAGGDPSAIGNRIVFQAGNMAPPFSRNVRQRLSIWGGCMSTQAELQRLATDRVP